MTQRTAKQNASLHLWLRQSAEALNDAGYGIKKVLMDNPVEIPWTEHSAKELLWRPVQEVMTGNESTAEQDKLAYSDIEKVVSRHISECTGVTLPPWPSEESL